MLITQFVMMTVACMISYHQNVPQPYLTDCRTLQHPVVLSVISRLSIVVRCTISMLS